MVDENQENRSRPYQVQIEILFLFGEEDVHALSKQLVKAPSIVRGKGELNAERALPPFGKVCYYSQADSWEATLDDHVEDILSIPVSDITALHWAASSSRAIIIVNYADDMPIIKLSDDFLTFASQLGGGIEFFFYKD